MAWWGVEKLRSGASLRVFCCDGPGYTGLSNFEATFTFYLASYASSTDGFLVGAPG
jgi:hypothetical protein